MGNISGLLGTAGGKNGTGFTGPEDAQIDKPVTMGQAQASTQSMDQLIQALQGQGGLQAQTDVYNQLQNIAAGRGPNPAQAMLNQATGANTANQAALMAGQRGAAQNTGMIARQAAMQGAANQQNAAGQGASMQAQQSLGALGQAQGQANTMAGQQIGTQTTQEQNLLNAIAQQNNAKVGMQSNINNANSGMMGATMGQQASIGSSMSKSVSSMMGGAEGGMPEDFPRIAMADGGVTAPAPIAPDTGGPLSAVGQWFSTLANMGNSGSDNSTKQAQKEEGADDQAGGAYDDKGTADPKQDPTAPREVNPGMSQEGFMSPGAEMGNTKNPIGSQDNSMNMMAAEGGKVPALVSPGERYLPPKEVKEV